MQAEIGLHFLVNVVQSAFGGMIIGLRRMIISLRENDNPLRGIKVNFRTRKFSIKLKSTAAESF